MIPQHSHAEMMYMYICGENTNHRKPMPNDTIVCISAVRLMSTSISVYLEMTVGQLLADQNTQSVDQLDNNVSQTEMKRARH